MPNGKYISLNNEGDEVLEQATRVGGLNYKNKIVMTNETGKLDPSLFPAGIGSGTGNSNTSSFPTDLLSLEYITSGSFVNILDDQGMQKIRLAKADDINRKAHGFVKDSVLPGDRVKVFIRGQIENQSGLIPGKDYFLSTSNLGGFTDTPPTSGERLWQKIGYGLEESILQVEIQQPIIRA